MSERPDNQSRRARRRNPDQSATEPAPSFPVWGPDQPTVSVTVTAPDLLTVRVFGVERALPDPAMGRRDQMGRVLDWAGAVIGGPYLAEVIEADGTVSTGWVTPAPRTAPPAAPQAPVEQAPWAPPPAATSPDPADWAEPDPAPDPGPLPAPPWTAAPSTDTAPALVPTGSTAAPEPAAGAAAPFAPGASPGRGTTLPGDGAAAGGPLGLDAPPDTQPPPAPPPPSPPVAPAVRDRPERAAPVRRWSRWLEFNHAAEGGGFTPGEEVVLALAVAGEAAGPDGRASIEVPRRVVAGLPTKEVVLFGRTSGTLRVCDFADQSEPSW
jgi:hypothetical protein